MSSVQEIQNAVRGLSPEYMAAFRLWFAEFDALLWDRRDQVLGPGSTANVTLFSVGCFDLESFTERVSS